MKKMVNRKKIIDKNILYRISIYVQSQVPCTEKKFFADFLLSCMKKMVNRNGISFLFLLLSY